MSPREIPALEGPVAEISRCLREGRPEEATELAGEVIRSRAPEALRQWLPQFEWMFGRDRPSAPPPELRLAPLAELLWANKEPALSDTYVLGYFLRFCQKSGTYDRFRPLLRRWIGSDWTPDFRFSESGDFSHFRELLRDQKRDFADAKYRRWKDFESEDFFRAVKGFSRFATVSSWVTNLLFEHRGDRSLSFPEWMRGFRSAETWKHILADTDTIQRLEKPGKSPVRYPGLPELSNLVDLGQARSVFAGLDLSRGLLLCTIHHAYLRLARECATLYMPEHRMLARGSGENNISTKTDGHLAVFNAVKVLRDRKMLLMVPDAKSGLKRGEKEGSEVAILGRSRLFADGAPTIAFESGCATGWYMVTRKRDRFVPVYEPGPRRRARESFTSFKERWWAFYAAQVEKLLTGNPRDIALHYNRRFVGPLPLRSGADQEGDADDDEMPM